MHHDELVGYAGSSVSAIFTITQTNEVFQTVQLILSILAVSVTIAYTVWKWWKNAKKDGKITIDEVENLFNNLKENIKEDEEDD